MPTWSYLLTIAVLTGCAADLGGAEVKGADAGDVDAPNAPEDPVRGDDAGLRDIDEEPKEVCDEVVGIRFEQREPQPDMMLVVDRSTSMSEPLFEGDTSRKWDIIRTGVASVVATQADRINFGLMLFPWRWGCNKGDVRVDIAKDNAGSVLQELNSSGPGSPADTPTEQSLRKVRDYYSNRPTNPDGRIVLLATDGLPNCGKTIGDTVNALTSLKQLDIKTYVLGFGVSANVDVGKLQQMAVAGGTNQVYTAGTTSELNNSLEAILAQVTAPACGFDLQQVPKDDADLNVSVNGVELERDGPNGWSYEPATRTVRLQGTACRDVRAGNVSAIDVDLGCKGIIVE